MTSKGISAGVEPKTRAFLESLTAQGGLQIYELSVEAARKVLSDAQAGEVAKLPVDVEERTVSAGTGGEVSIRIVRPKGNAGVLPVVLYFHGGGWVLGYSGTRRRTTGWCERLRTGRGRRSCS